MKLSTQQIEDIRSEVIIEIGKDMAMDDYTAIYELLQFIPIENLIGYLPEETTKKIIQ